MAKIDVRNDPEEDLAKVAAKFDGDAATSAIPNVEMKEAQRMLADFAVERAEAGKIRSEEYANYLKATEDLKQGRSDVRKALLSDALKRSVVK